jgi:hypothetical protein
VGWWFAKRKDGSLSTFPSQHPQLLNDVASVASRCRMMKSNERPDIYALLDEDESMSIPALWWLN